MIIGGLKASTTMQILCEKNEYHLLPISGTSHVSVDAFSLPYAE